MPRERKCVSAHHNGMFWADTLVSVNANGTFFVSGGVDGLIRTWSVAEAKEEKCVHIGSHSNSSGAATLSSAFKKPPEVKKSEVTALALSEDGRRIVAARGDKEVLILDPQKLEKQNSFKTGHTCKIKTVGMSVDGTVIATLAWNKSIRVHDPSSPNTEIRKLKGRKGGTCVSKAMSMTRDGNTVFALHGNGYKLDGIMPCNGFGIWDLRSLQRVARIKGEEASSICSLSISPDGTTIATGTGNRRANRVLLWDARMYAVRETLHGHNGNVTSVSFSGSGNVLVSGASLEQNVRTWSAKDGKVISVLETERAHTAPRGAAKYIGISDVSISTNGIIAAGDRRHGRVLLWDAWDEHQQYEQPAVQMKEATDNPQLDCVSPITSSTLQQREQEGPPVSSGKVEYLSYGNNACNPTSGEVYPSIYKSKEPPPYSVSPGYL